jgi:hypothetical protein
MSQTNCAPLCSGTTASLRYPNVISRCIRPVSVVIPEKTSAVLIPSIFSYDMVAVLRITRLASSVAIFAFCVKEVKAMTTNEDKIAMIAITMINSIRVNPFICENLLVFIEILQ